MSAPLVSVVLSAHNAAAFVDEAIGSILDQSHGHLELIAVDDASTDQTAARLHAAEGRDRRVRVLRNERRLGLAASLNRALAEVRGELIARMDADDVALPDRLARQVSAFQADPGLVLLGSNVEHIDREGGHLDRTELPLDDWTIRCVAMGLNPFAHPTVVMRTAALRTEEVVYDTGFETTQDWELWTRMMAHGRVANIARPLVRQRLHAASTSATRRASQADNSLRVQERYVRRFLGPGAWDRARFSRMNTVFYGDRREADAAGEDRVAACQDALGLLDAVLRRYPDRPSGGYRAFVVERCLRIGLAPPLRRGAVALAGRLLIGHPGATLAGITGITGRQAYRAAPG